MLPSADAQVVLPFTGGTREFPIAVSAQPSALDVHFSVDTTGSIAEEIDQLQADLTRIIAPGLRRRVQRVSFGVSRFADFPEEPFGFSGGGGEPPDTPYELLTPITESLSRVQAAVARLDQPLSRGGDLPEAGAEALWQIATGEGYLLHGKALIRRHRPASKGDGGGVGFRVGALRVVLHVTDAPSHTPAEYGDTFPRTHSLQEAGSALRLLRAKLVGIVTDACDDDALCDAREYRRARTELERLALQTGAIGEPPGESGCPHGVQGKLVPAMDGRCPLVFDVDEAGGGLTDAILDGIVGLLEGIRYQTVSGLVVDDPLGFVIGMVPVEPNTSSAAATADLLPEGRPDGRRDSFIDVRAKTRLEFRVQLRNDRIAPSDVEQTFRVAVAIEGDGLVLERRTLRIRVPPGPALIPAQDADAGR